jgi:hypothetical protein
MVRIARVQRRNDDARVDGDYRHSRRRFFNASFG